MNICKLGVSNLLNRPMGTLLSVVLLTLGVGIISLLLHVGNQVEEQMTNNLRGVDMVVGAKGSPLQLILSAIYHVDAPTGNIPLDEAKKVLKNRLVDAGILLAYGDSYKGHRIVGTEHSYPELYQAVVSQGEIWKRPLDVTVGAIAAQRLKLNLGDSFHGSHGLTGGETHESHAYRVVGIFEFSNSILDQLILTATESVWEVHHDVREGEGEIAHEGHDHEEDHEITAMLVRFKNPTALIQLPRMVNESTNMQAAVPSYEINRLLRLMGMSIDVFYIVGLVLLVISGLSIFISLYNALKDRQYELALMRTYGATRRQLVGLVLWEGMLLTITGFFLGLAVSRLGLWLISSVVEIHSHYSFSGPYWIDGEWWLLVATVVIGLLASLLPSIGAFNLNISKTLADA